MAPNSYIIFFFPFYKKQLNECSRSPALCPRAALLTGESSLIIEVQFINGHSAHLPLASPSRTAFAYWVKRTGKTPPSKKLSSKLSEGK